MFNFAELKQPMNLNGGIDEYSFEFKRYGNGVSPQGRKVRYLNENGYDLERERANKFFKEGDILEVKEIYVGRSSSKVEFIGFEGKMFNTVMFEDVE